MTRFLILLTILISAVSCSKDNEGSNADVDLDISGLLTHAADNIIIPAYDAAEKSTKVMKEAKDTFIANPNQINLTFLKEKWREAFIDWQKAAPFDFGPAEEGSIGLNTIFKDLNTFPVDLSKIESAISNGDLIDQRTKQAKGFVAIDYLLFHVNDTKILEEFDENRINYLSSVIDDIHNRISTSNKLWKEGYRDDFISNTSNSAGSSLSMYYNEFLKSFEFIKQFKLALPAGKQIGQSAIRPDLLETRYDTELALTLVKVHLKITEDIWFGTSSDGQDGVGFDDLLQAAGENQLINDTKLSINEINLAIGQLDNLANDLEANLPKVENAIDKLQQHTRYYKSDLSGVLGISITFSDGDGD